MLDFTITQFDPANASEFEYAAYGEFRNRMRKEHLPDDPPIPLDEQIQQAKNIPDFFEILAYLAWDPPHETVMAGAQLEMYRSGENSHIAFLGLEVLQEYRRQSLAKTLLHDAYQAAVQRERRLIMAQTFDSVPAGKSFMKRLGGWKSPLSLDDLQVDSAYNTYQIPGLPPGPIANPSLSALRAVAFPADTPYYYFRAACDGSGRHNFAETFEQHQSNSCP